MDNVDLAASLIIPNENRQWMEDHKVKNCHSCKILFGYSIRKHHCRYCGNIFCWSCSQKTIVIPDFITTSRNLLIIIICHIILHLNQQEIKYQKKFVTNVMTLLIIELKQRTK